MSNVLVTGGGDQPSSPTKQRKMRGGKKFEKFDKSASSESGAVAVASSAQGLDPPIDKEMCSLESWLECSSDHLEGFFCISPPSRSALCLILMQGQIVRWINRWRLPAYAGIFIFLSSHHRAPPLTCTACQR
jgi:hypothetical protein